MLIQNLSEPDSADAHANPVLTVLRDPVLHTMGQWPDAVSDLQCVLLREPVSVSQKHHRRDKQASTPEQDGDSPLTTSLSTIAQVT